MTERWLPVVGYEGLYEVSDLGRVRSLDRVLEQFHPKFGVYERRFRGRLLKAKVCTKGPYGNWLNVMLGRGRDGSRYHLVSRLVLAAFVGACPQGMEAAHNNGDPEDNRLTNLRWDTHSSNQLDIRRCGHHTKMIGSPRLSDTEVRAIRRAVKGGATLKSQALRYGFKLNKGHAQAIAAIVHGRTYTRV